MLNYLIAILVIILLTIYIYLKNALNYFNKHNILHDPGYLLLGNFNGVGSKLHVTNRIQEIYNKYVGKDVIFGMYFLTQPVIVVSDLDLIKKICVKDFNKFHDRGMYVNEKDDPLSANLFSLDGQRWRNMRTKLSPTFTSGKMKQMFKIVIDISNELANLVHSLTKTKKPVEIKSLVVRFTADVIGSCAFGLQCNALKNGENCEILKISKKIFKPDPMLNLQFFFLNAFQDLSRFLGLRLFPKNVGDYFLKITRDTVDYRERENIRRNDFIDLLIQMKNHGKIKISDDGDDEYVDTGKITLDELTAHAFIFFFAGFDTSSTAMSFALLELSRNLDIQDRARQEIIDVLEKYNGEITYEAVGEMHYLEKVINESLRKYPTIPFLVRRATDDYKIEGTDHIITKGMQVFISIHSIHHDENIFPNPDKFDPERFTPENINSRHQFAFLPFGEGPRICIGMRFALIQLKVGLIQLLKQYQFRFNEKTNYPIKFEPANLNILVEGGIWLDIEEL